MKDRNLRVSFRDPLETPFVLDEANRWRAACYETGDTLVDVLMQRHPYSFRPRVSPNCKLDEYCGVP